ncbi:hypothetical protein [Pseudonocardia sp. TRM90224]|uniref:hypothetical protein n=1 Tax=Pseudonocardia sp. TRM90224 TaxID=2812678 RepID=UPI001E49BB17|nr:hypothetical protein [Pseudonocardia sp. TRM90224]
MRARLVLLLIMAVVLGACGGPAAPRAATTAPGGVQRIELTFRAGAVTGGVTRYAVPLGSTVDLVVGSDVADEVHLHGYDRSSFVTAGATTTLRFVADLPGVFDVELEQRRIPLTQVQVS